MVLPLTTTRSPDRDGPPQGLADSGVRHSIAPVLELRQKRARSPTFSLSRKAEATRTRSPATAIGASTCHLSLPCCQSSSGVGLGKSSSLGGTASSAFFFLSS